MKNNNNCRVLIWGVLHCRCERTQTQQAQYNEFSREAGSRTGPLRGLRHRSGRIFREQDHQRGRGGAKVCPRASSEDEFFFSSSDTSLLELSGVFRTAIPPLREVSLVIYPSAPFILVVHLLTMQVATWVSVPSNASFWRSVSSCGPHRAVQGSHPHQWGQSVSCVYLIWRWWLLLGLSPHHPPMASP